MSGVFPFTVFGRVGCLVVIFPSPSPGACTKKGRQGFERVKENGFVDMIFSLL